MKGNESWEFTSATDRELMNIYFNSKVGFADESIFLARLELESRGYEFQKHYDAGNITGFDSKA